MATRVCPAISFLDVGAPLLSAILTEAGVDCGVESLHLRACWVTATKLVPLTTEADDVTRNAGDEVPAVASGDRASGSPLQNPLEESGASGGRGGRWDAL